MNLRKLEKRELKAIILFLGAILFTFGLFYGAVTAPGAECKLSAPNYQKENPVYPQDDLEELPEEADISYLFDFPQPDFVKTVEPKVQHFIYTPLLEFIPVDEIDPRVPSATIRTWVFDTNDDSVIDLVYSQFTFNPITYVGPYSEDVIDFKGYTIVAESKDEDYDDKIDLVKIDNIDLREYNQCIKSCIDFCICDGMKTGADGVFDILLKGEEIETYDRRNKERGINIKFIL